MDTIHPHKTGGQPLFRAAKNAQNPLIVVCPHAGIHTPDDFQDMIAVDLQDVLSRGDRYTDWLSKYAPDHGAQLVYSTIAPAYLNVGRAIDSIHPEDVRGSSKNLKCNPKELNVDKRQGQGLIAMKTLYGGFPIYKEGMEPDEKEIKRRINEFYYPFHNTIDEAVKDNLHKHGLSLLFDVHSCPDIGAFKDPDEGQQRADIILSDRFGQSCDPSYIRLLYGIGHDFGFSVKVNDPYGGGFNTRNYGLIGPYGTNGAQALQIEWNRKTMGIDQQTFEILDQGKFDKVARCHDEMIASLAMAVEVL